MARRWKWVDPPTSGYYEGLLEQLIEVAEDGSESEVCNFGDNTQYYPTAGSSPSDADKLLIAASPLLLDACKVALARMKLAYGIRTNSLGLHGGKLAEEIALIEQAIQAAEPNP